jgi:hypothetical protein
MGGRRADQETGGKNSEYLIINLLRFKPAQADKRAKGEVARKTRLILETPCLSPPQTAVGRPALFFGCPAAFELRLRSQDKSTVAVWVLVVGSPLAAPASGSLRLQAMVTHARLLLVQLDTLSRQR